MGRCRKFLILCAALLFFTSVQAEIKSDEPDYDAYARTSYLGLLAGMQIPTCTTCESGFGFGAEFNIRFSLGWGMGIFVSSASGGTLSYTPFGLEVLYFPGILGLHGGFRFGAMSINNDAGTAPDSSVIAGVTVGFDKWIEKWLSVGLDTHMLVGSPLVVQFMLATKLWF